ncbi:WD40-repeat-containing domain protein [Zopfochytrium polystomum]|nr:WD40-repeat-containing domain protein [Zopfochytrium polystomum]
MTLSSTFDHHLAWRTPPDRFAKDRSPRQLRPSFSSCSVASRSDSPTTGDVADTPNERIVASKGGIKDSNFFFSSVQWSPDGTCLLSNSNDNVLRVFETATALQTAKGETASSTAEVLWTVAGESVYDYCWYPFMNSADPSTCCFLSSTRDHPITLYDAYTGRLRASYTAYTKGDLVTAPHSITFSPDGAHILAGFTGSCQIFDLSRPNAGTPLVAFSTASQPKTSKNSKGPATKRSKLQKGVISALAYDPTREGVVAVGSYCHSVGLYDVRASCADRRVGSLAGMAGSGHGVTQLRFAGGGNHIFVAARRSGVIRGYDLRNLDGGHVVEVKRAARTNQRMGFGIGADGTVGVAGDDRGALCLFDTSRGADLLNLPVTSSVISSASFHPLYYNSTSVDQSVGFVAISYGQRDQSPQDSCSDSEDDSESEQERDDEVGVKATRGTARSAPDTALAVYRVDMSRGDDGLAEGASRETEEGNYSVDAPMEEAKTFVGGAASGKGEDGLDEVSSSVTEEIHVSVGAPMEDVETFVDGGKGAETQREERTPQTETPLVDAEVVRDRIIK